MIIGNAAGESSFTFFSVGALDRDVQFTAEGLRVSGRANGQNAQYGYILFGDPNLPTPRE